MFTESALPRSTAARSRRHHLVAGIVVLAGALSLTSLTAVPSHAASPSSPVLVAPASGSTATSATPTLSVTAADPDGGSLDVTFEGRKAGATVPGAGDADPFSIVVIPDTQNYTYGGRQGLITQQAEWIVSSRAELGTAMVVQVGDLVSNFDNVGQWNNVSNGLRPLDDAHVPNTVLPGNHDFDNATGAVGLYDQYFPPSRYAGAGWTPSSATYGGYLGQNLFGPDPIDRRNMDNFALFTAGGRDFLVLNLEWEAPQYALDWADKVLAAYPDRIAIMATHSFISTTGTRRTTAQRPGGNSAAVLWSSFVSQHCSIRLVLSGHEHNGDLGEARRTDPNACGQPVQQVMTDYQDRANGGNGWLRYYTFDPADNTMVATTYSPTLDQYETDDSSAFTLPFDLAAPQPAPFAPIATRTISSGATASTVWSGLQPDTLYEWRAVSRDGTNTTTSPTWTVRTPPRTDIVDDTFTRTAANAWGTADTAQQWTTTTQASSYSVDGSRAKMVVPAAGGRGGRLTSTSIADGSILTDLTVTPAQTGSGLYVWLMGRQGSAGSYRAKVQFGAAGAVTVSLLRAAPTETSLVSQRVPGLTLTPGQQLRLRFDYTGSAPTTLKARVWLAGDPEPTTWNVTTTDSTAALQGSGAVGIDSYLSGSATSPATVLIDRFTVSVPGTPPPGNVAPTAVIGTPTIDERTVQVSGSGSTDSDGAIVAYVWNFGDGTPTVTAPTASHTYAADGTYTVRLTVTDDDGATGTTTRAVDAAADPPPNDPPTAVIGTPVIDQRTVQVSGTGSSDSDGTVVSYAWTFGDGATASTATASHTYAADGTYTVRLTVTDDDDGTGTTTRTVTVAATPPANDPPTAVIGTPVIDQRTVQVSGTGSSDSDGTVASYAWVFGDGATASTATASHTYAADGTYTVRLTVTDDDGATDTTTRTVTVAATPTSETRVRDDFGRTVATGWGQAELGGAWTTAGSAAYAVGSGVATQRITTAGASSSITLRSTTTTSCELRASVAWSRIGSAGTVYSSLIVRAVSTTSDYRLNVTVPANGRPNLVLSRRVNGTETTVAQTTLNTVTVAPGTSYSVAVRALRSGSSTVLSAKLWARGTTEPSAWQVTGTDATAALQAAGWTGFNGYMSSSATAPITTTFDDVRVTTVSP